MVSIKFLDFMISKPTLKIHISSVNKFAKGDIIKRGRYTTFPTTIEKELIEHINQLEGILLSAGVSNR